MGLVTIAGVLIFMQTTLEDGLTRILLGSATVLPFVPVKLRSGIIYKPSLYNSSRMVAGDKFVGSARGIHINLRW